MTFKRRVLSALGKEELLEIGRGLGLPVTTRMTVDELRDAVAGSKRAGLTAIVTSELPRDTLKAICRANALDDTGKEKQVLIERILAAAGGASLARDRGPGYGGTMMLPGLEPAPTSTPALTPTPTPTPTPEPTPTPTPTPEPTPTAKPRGKAKAKGDAEAKPEKGARRRRAGLTEDEAVVSGSLKAALRQFALGAAGGYQGKDAALAFTTHLLECFGWPGGRPPEAELGKRVAIAEAGARVEREVALWWPQRRAMLEVVPHEATLDVAWKDVVRVCLQLDPPPQYVVLTNQRDVHLYDLARDRTAPRLATSVDDLPKYSEAFPFFTTTWVPGQAPKIVNVEKVSAEVADLVARLYRSVRGAHPGRDADVIRFTLQCITAMFAEDIGLLPKNYFTSLLYEGGRRGDVAARLRELFLQMNTPPSAADGARVVPYFNGGLFTEVSELSLGSEQIVALTKAAEANWTYVDPHIFGSVFQGIMDDAERHASGAHYTAHDDIMRVVGPTIVEPWRRRITAASSLRELTELRAELVRFRVLDPACGSGNFLYVAFRELYRLDTELLSRMREYVSAKGKLSWNGGILTTNFFGIDINPFAVELAKVTLNIAKKIAFEERKAQAFALLGQVEMDVDPSLPLDNLDGNVMCKDALFSEWPEVEAIVGNPPFLGGQKIRKELGADYMSRLQSDTGFTGIADIVCYWFRRAHDHLPIGGRAGLVATSAIRIGDARKAALDYIVSNGGVITHAVSSQPWPGVAALHVSMVNWSKGDTEGPHQLIVDNQTFLVDRIPPHLQLHSDVSTTVDLLANSQGTTMGVIFGHDSFLSTSDAFPTALARDSSFLRPVASATPLLTGELERVSKRCIFLSNCRSEEGARQLGGEAFEHLRRHVKPHVEAVANTYPGWLSRWWHPWAPRPDFWTKIQGTSRYIVCSSPQARPIFAFLSSAFVPTNTLQVFAFDDDYSFGVIQSSLHWEWTKAKGGRVTDRIRYTTDVWRTFPWPQEPTDAQVVAVAVAARALRATRDALMRENSWSLRQLYQAAEVEGPHPLKDAQTALDAAVADAYGQPPDQGAVEFLLELNGLVAEDEAAGRGVRGPGLPAHLSPTDPRFTSTDCIQPPPLEPA